MPDKNIEESQAKNPDQVVSGAGDSVDLENAGKAPEQLLEEVLASPLPGGRKEIALPSGATAVMRPGKGRDLLAAQRAAGQDTHQVMYGLVANLCTFDGEKKVLEDVLDMPLADVMKLIGAVGEAAGDDFLPSTPALSSTSRP